MVGVNAPAAPQKGVDAAAAAVVAEAGKVLRAYKHDAVADLAVCRAGAGAG